MHVINSDKLELIKLATCTSKMKTTKILTIFLSLNILLTSMAAQSVG